MFWDACAAQTGLWRPVKKNQSANWKQWEDKEDGGKKNKEKCLQSGGVETEVCLETGQDVKPQCRSGAVRVSSCFAKKKKRNISFVVSNLKAWGCLQPQHNSCTSASQSEPPPPPLHTRLGGSRVHVWQTAAAIILLQLYFNTLYLNEMFGNEYMWKNKMASNNFGRQKIARTPSQTGSKS